MLMQALDRYLRMRRALGYQLAGTESLLQDFVRFAITSGDITVMSHTAIAWAKQTTTQAQGGRRLGVVIRFAEFLHAEDPRHEIPPKGVFCGSRPRPTPYILTDEETQLLVQQALQLGPLGSLRPQTFGTLLALFSVTGLRVAEALSLRLDDFQGDTLLVRESKFHKSRLLPLHPTSAAALEQYRQKRLKVAGASDHLFVSRTGSKLTYDSVHQTFRKLCDAARLPRQACGGRIRLLDLRHTFAVRVLQACPDDRNRITRHTMALTTYMGHASIGSTYWYLETTPQLMRDIAHACEHWGKEETP